MVTRRGAATPRPGPGEPLPPGLDVLVKVVDRPDELYLRGLASLQAFVGEGAEITLRVGLARVSDSRFQAGAVRHDAIVEIRGRVPILARQ